MAIWEGNKTRLKAYLLSSNLKVVFKKTKSLLYTKTIYTNNYNFENLEYSTSVDGFIPVDLTNEKYSHLKALKNDFIYRTEEYYSDVKMYSLLNEGVYIIKGKKHCKKIVLKE